MFTNIPSAVLRKMVLLSERKEALLARIQEIDRAMMRLPRGITSSGSDDDRPGRLNRIRSSARKTRRQRTARGQLKKRVLAALQRAGKRGAAISDLSKKLGVKRANLYVWFNGTGRKVRGLKKIAPARYRLD